MQKGNMMQESVHTPVRAQEDLNKLTDHSISAGRSMRCGTNEEMVQAKEGTHRWSKESEQDGVSKEALLQLSSKFVSLPSNDDQGSVGEANTRRVPAC